MSKNLYSFGEESPLTFVISDSLARHYNEAAKKYLVALRKYSQKPGRQWNPTKDPIDPGWTRKQLRAWNDFNKIFKRVVEDAAEHYHPNDIMSDFLTKHESVVYLIVEYSGEKLIRRATQFGAFFGWFVRPLLRS